MKMVEYNVSTLGRITLRSSEVEIRLSWYISLAKALEKHRTYLAYSSNG